MNQDGASTRILEVAPGEAGLRLDRWFRRRFPEVPHGRLQKLLRTGQVRLDGKRIKAGARLIAGQSVRVPPLGEAPPPRAVAKKKPPPPSPAEAEALREMVIHMDRHVIVLDKPPGLAVQGGSKVARHLDAMLDALRFDSNERPRLAHRLDKDTSGVLVLGRDAAAAARLTAAFRAKTARKLYWAVVVGVPRPSAGRVDLSLAKAAAPGGERMTPSAGGGKKALTLYRVVERAGNRAAWLALEPRTGRTHQLRAHCAALGTPILGDGKFGAAAAFIDGLESGRMLHLHARAIRIPHPGGGVLEAAAPLPGHMTATWRFFEFDENAAEGGFSGDGMA